MRVANKFRLNRGARDEVVNGRRNIDNDGDNIGDNIGEFPPPQNLPPLDMAQMEELYRKVNNGEAVENDAVIKSAFGMMMHVASSLNKVNNVNDLAKNNRDRISALEAKVGDAGEVATSLGLAIQNLPLPAGGASEIDNVREALSHIRAPGVVDNDIVKAVRKGFKEETRQGAGDAKLGTVLVEISNTEVKGRIMKNKRVLENHVNPILKNLRIKNMKSQDQLNHEFATRQMLKMVPGGEGWYVAGNGRLCQVRPGGGGAGRAGQGQQGGGQQQQGGRPQLPPPAQQFNVPPPAPAPAAPVAVGPGQQAQPLNNA